MNWTTPISQITTIRSFKVLIYWSSSRINKPSKRITWRLQSRWSTPWKKQLGCANMDKRMRVPMICVFHHSSRARITSWSIRILNETRRRSWIRRSHQRWWVMLFWIIKVMPYSTKVTIVHRFRQVCWSRALTKTAVLQSQDTSLLSFSRTCLKETPWED